MHKVVYKLIIVFCITLMTFGLIMEAHAKRFGGGRSFGMSRASSSYSQKSNSFSKNSSANYSRIQNNRPSLRSFLGPIAGFVMGGLLASLFMGHGFGTGMLSWFVILAGGLLLWQLFRNKFQQPVTSPMQFNTIEAQDNQQSDRLKSFHQATSTADEFDAENFLRQAKVLFIRLQAAYDHKNLADIRTFTTPEIYAEIQLQLNERGDQTNFTEVISLNAELLGTEMVLRETIASVRFSGTLKEDIHQSANPFNEIWHFKKQEEDQSQWQVAGIQQEESP